MTFFKWQAAVREMNRIRSSYARQNSNTENVHSSLVCRAIEHAIKITPQAADYFFDNIEILNEYSTIPDHFSDYEKGTGWHYYCACSTFGRRFRPVHGYYKNGKGRFSKSARTMLEEDYTMSLTLYAAGYYEVSAQYLGRALHMVSDICCLPHATKMTYFSPMASVHKAYEQLARVMYPEFVPKIHLTAGMLGIFTDRKNFSAALNGIVNEQIRERKKLLSDPEKEIRHRLYCAERAAASLLVRYWQDTSLPPEIAHYIADGSMCRLFGSIKATVQVRKSGIRFLPDRSETPLGRYISENEFTAAHRSNGLFTISPTSDRSNGRVLCSDGKLRSFDPTDKRQMFRIL